MFETMTYENILNDMLSRVTSDVDKREGSVIYDALGPAAYHLSQTYFYLDSYIDLFYLDTAVGEFLDRKAADYGEKRKAATYAVRRLETNGTVSLGARWGIEDVVYKITGLVSTNVYSATCETAGTIGNSYSGELNNIDNVSGVTATLTGIITNGEDEETDKELRDRILDYLRNPSQDANVAQYKEWATSYAGIGTAKVFPLWNGGNTVRVAITNSEKLPAGSSLVASFQEYIDPDAEGLGNGVAPIGSKVTVTGGTAKNITVTANVVLAEGYTEAEGASKAISDYLASITYAKNSVSYMRVGSTLLDCDSISELSGLKINNGISDITLSGDEIPVLSGLNLTVVVV